MAALKKWWQFRWLRPLWENDASRRERILTELATQVLSKDPETRERAAAELARTGDPRAAGPLIEALKHPLSHTANVYPFGSGYDTGDSPIGVKTVHETWYLEAALAQLGSAAVEPLLDLARGRRFYRGAVVRILAQTRDPQAFENARVLDFLVEALANCDHDSRQYTNEALGRFTDEQVVDAFLKKWEKDPTTAVPVGVLTRMGRCRSHRCIKPLLSLLLHEDRDTRQGAVTTLNEIDRYWARSRVAKATISSLITHLLAPDALVRGAALHALAMINPDWPKTELAAPAIPMALSSLKEADYRSREAAAEALAALKDVRAVGPLLETLTDDIQAVRCAVARALGKIGDPCAVTALIAALHDSDEGVRCAVAESLGEIGDLGAAEALRAASMNDGHSLTRQAAAKALIMMGVHG